MALASQALKYNHVFIQSPNTGGKAIDLTAHLEHMEYFENIMSPTISMKMKIRSSFNFVSGLPIRGGEMIAIELETLGGTFKFGKVDGDGIKPGSGELYVYGMKNLDQPSQAQTFTLHIVPLEYFKNETSRCMSKFKSQTIDQHVRQILGPHVMNINPDRIGIIEKTKNTYSFIGNTKPPTLIAYTFASFCVLSHPHTRFCGLLRAALRAFAYPVVSFPGSRAKKKEALRPPLMYLFFGEKQL